MTDKNTYWISDSEGTHALVTGAEERDRYKVLGWVDAKEPTEGWLHIWRDGIEQPGLVPTSALDTLWGPLGWVAGPPPGGVHPATSASRADQSAETKPEPKPAAGGNAKSKE